MKLTPTAEAILERHGLADRFAVVNGTDGTHRTKAEALDARARAAGRPGPRRRPDGRRPALRHRRRARCRRRLGRGDCGATAAGGRAGRDRRRPPARRPRGRCSTCSAEPPGRRRPELSEPGVLGCADHEPADPPRRACRPPGRRAGRAARRPAARPVRHRGRQRAHPRRRALAGPAAGRPARRRPRPAATASAPASTSPRCPGSSSARSARRRPQRREDPWRPSPGGLAAAARARRRPGRGLGRPAVELPRRPAGPTRAAPTGRRRAPRRADAGPRRPAVVDRPPPGRALRALRRRPARHGRRPGPPGATSTARAARCRRDRAWQAELWRRLRTELDAPSPAERVAAGTTALARRPRPSSDLPARLSVFGATRLEPAAPRRARRARPRAVTCTSGSRTPHPPCGRPSPPRRQRRDLRPPAPSDRSDGAARHRLLAYLGRDVRELQLVLQAAGVPLEDHHHAAPPAAAPAPRLLQHLQRGIAANQPPAEEARPAGCSPPTTGASGCTARTAPTARSRCCARCWWGCWPTTRPWSRATSS